RLMEDGSEYGIQVVQENVNKHRSADPKFLAKMKLQLGDALKFTFDVKQSMRAGFSVDDFLEAIGKDIVHIHISDQGDRGDCLLPGDGTFDFSHLFQRMNAFKFSGDYIFEVYRECYKKHEDVIKKYNKYIKMWYNDI
ncbi:MAG: TIM barrel protein, partial [Oscillospiraceae bacterium]